MLEAEDSVAVDFVLVVADVMPRSRREAPEGSLWAEDVARNAAESADQTTRSSYNLLNNGTHASGSASPTHWPVGHAMLQSLLDNGFQVEFHSHAKAILSVDFPEVAEQLQVILLGSTIPIEEIIGSGGGETKGTQRLRRALHDHGWRKHKFEIQRTIDGVARESISHEVDHIARFDAGVVALEIEWNNKDPFFDRDLENYKRLHADGAVSLGILVTRGMSLQDDMRAMVLRFATENGIKGQSDLERIGLNPTRRQLAEYARRQRGDTTFAQAWAAAFVQDKFGAATTHWRKLEDRVHRGVGNPCPLLLIGLPANLVTFGEPEAVVEKLIEEGTTSVD